jgi:phosphoglycerate dehydrogenase-like enzyme
VNLQLTPHMAGITDESNHAVGVIVVADVPNALGSP